MKKMVALLIMMIFPVIAGCGGGGGTPAPTAATLKISATPGSLPAGKAVSGIAVTIELPAGVTVKTTTSNVVDPTVVVPSGVWALAGTSTPATAALGPVVYTPAVGATKAKLDFTIASTVLAGVGEGEYVTVNFLLAGVSPAASDFNLLSFQAFDLSFANIAAVTPVKVVTLH